MLEARTCEWCCFQAHQHVVIPHVVGHLCFLQGSEDHSEGGETLSFPLLPLCLLLLSFSFSISFKVNLSDCHNVIVFLAPSVVSLSLPHTPTCSERTPRRVFLGKRDTWDSGKDSLKDKAL